VVGSERVIAIVALRSPAPVVPGASDIGVALVIAKRRSSAKRSSAPADARCAHMLLREIRLALSRRVPNAHGEMTFDAAANEVLRHAGPHATREIPDMRSAWEEHRRLSSRSSKAPRCFVRARTRPGTTIAPPPVRSGCTPPRSALEYHGDQTCRNGQTTNQPTAAGMIFTSAIATPLRRWAQPTAASYVCPAASIVSWKR
jgi:hypothetical protein